MEIMTRAELIEAISRICSLLQAPLPLEELAAGWSEANALATLRYFENVNSDLCAGVNIPFFSLVRTLDSCGISDGNLLEEACRINNAINRLS